MSDSESVIGRHVWQTRYRLSGPDGEERSPAETFRRVARAVAAAEPREARGWADRFESALVEGRFLPGGRILAGAGTGRRVTLFNCFVLGTIEDSLDGIFTALREGAVTMQAGGGIGYDFSTLRPRGLRALATGGVASGPVSFMRLWDRMCETLETANNRRGAMMATLRCDHPDIEEFIDAKREGQGLSNFNLSVQLTDGFLEAVRNYGPHTLVFPGCEVARELPARALWRRMLASAAASGEPGFLFVDRINQTNNLWYRERISATNPCGEEPLPPYGACNLGSINLTAFVRAPFTSQSSLDLEGLAATTAVAVRFLDDVIDVSSFPLPAQEGAARSTRRIGLGITGLADALVMLGLAYGDEAARAVATQAAACVAQTAYRTSIGLAAEKGPCPAFERTSFLAAPFVASLPPEVRDGIGRYGIRNSHLLAIAPAGSISLLAGNVSSGIEPIFRARYRRALRVPGSFSGETETVEVVDHAVAAWLALGADHGSLPPAYVDAETLPPEAHLAMQLALQPHVDSAISKTIQLPPGFGPDELDELCNRAYAGGLKGFTVFPRISPIGAVLLPEPSEACDAPACAMPV